MNFDSCTSLYAQSPLDLIGRTITGIRVEQEGRVVSDPLILGLIETRIGSPLSMADVRETIDHIYGIGRFDDVQVVPEASAAGVVVRFLLLPSHPVDQVIFRGTLGLPEPALRQAMVQRYGAQPPITRLEEVAQSLRALYRDYGYLKAEVTPRVEQYHDPDRSTVIFTVDAGPRAPAGSLRVEGVSDADKPALLDRLGLATGRTYDIRVLRNELDRYEQELRRRGYYEARADLSPEYAPSGEAALTIVVDRGPHVVVAFAGDRLPARVAQELVPIEQEASVDEDLLENASIAIEDYLKKRGYRDATSSHTRQARGDELVITFTITRGPRYVVDAFEARNNQAATAGELRALLPLEPGDPFVQATLDSGVAAMRELYRRRGFNRVRLDPLISVLPRAAGEGAAADARVQIAVTVTEGVQTLVGSVSIEGNTALSESQVRALMTSAPGQPLSQVQVASDLDRIETEYLNQGYQSAVATAQTTLTQNDTRADLRMSISEGPQVTVDHIIILGNERTGTATIRRAITLRAGGPLGYAARIESQQRLAALGLFRRVQITERRHGSEPRSDIIVQVEEAPPTTLGYGGGLEAGRRLRTSDTGEAEERFDLAPRGFFEIGRRNLWGKNRAVNLFTRASLRARDEQLRSGVVDTRYGLNDYRIVGSYREPRFLDSPADLLVNGILEQSIRSSFNFKTRGVNAQAGARLPKAYSVTGTYSFRHTRLFGEHYSEDEKPLIDRLFPQVRLSTFGGTLVYDTRNEVLDPDRGLFLAVENDVAARVYGSEVGFVRTSVQASTYRRLPSRRRLVLALASRLGIARGFVEAVNDQLPASERFFAGGDTTVRGFSLDRLGDENTITSTGFPTGGNGLIVMNAELRVAMFGGLTAATFVDAGNVFLKAGDLNLTNLRPAAGIGVRYRSPIGPIRVDWGFNLDPRELVPGRLERGNVLHISLGQAF